MAVSPAVFPAVALSGVAVPLPCPSAVGRPALVDGVHGAACAPVCAPGDAGVVFEVPWLERVEGVDVDGDDELPPDDCAIAGTASARLSATPPAHVMTFLLT